METCACTGAQTTSGFRQNSRFQCRSKKKFPPRENDYRIPVSLLAAIELALLELERVSVAFCSRTPQPCYALFGTVRSITDSTQPLYCGYNGIFETRVWVCSYVAVVRGTASSSRRSG